MGLAALIIGLGAVALAYGSAFAPAPWSEYGVMLMAVAQPLVLVGGMALATGTRLANDWRWRATLLLTWLLATVGFVGALLMAPERADAALWLGMPPRATLVFALVGAAPMVLLPLVYALTFESPAIGERRVPEERASS